MWNLNNLLISENETGLFCKVGNGTIIILQDTMCDTGWQMHVCVCMLSYAGYEQHPLVRVYQSNGSNKVCKCGTQSDVQN